MVTAALVLPFVTMTGFARPRAKTTVLPRATILHALIGTFFMPGLLEETIYRAAMLPRLLDDYSALRLSQLVLSSPAANINMSLVFQLTFSLLLFVAMHPINGIFFRPAARSTFCDLRFLSVCGM